MFQLALEERLKSETAIVRWAPKSGQFLLGTTSGVKLLETQDFRALWTWKSSSRLYPSQTPYLLKDGRIAFHGSRAPRISSLKSGPRGPSLVSVKRAIGGFPANDFAVSRDGRFVAIRGLNRELELWRYRKARKFFAGLGGFYLTEFHPKGACVVVDNETSTAAHILNLSKRATTAKIELPGGLGGWGTGHRRAVFLSETDEVLVVSRQGIVRIHWPSGRTADTTIKSKSRSVNLHYAGQTLNLLMDGILGIALSPSEKRLAVAVNNEVRFFRVEERKLVFEKKTRVRTFSMTFASEHQLALIPTTTGPELARLLLYEE